MLSKYVLVLSLVSASAFSESLPTSKDYAPFMGAAEGCKVSVVKEKEQDPKTFLDCETIKYEREQSFLDDAFLRWATLKTNSKTFVLIFFVNGAHGETAVIFDKALEKPVKILTSSWPIKIGTEDNIVKLEYKKESNEKGEYSTYFYVLK